MGPRVAAADSAGLGLFPLAVCQVSDGNAVPKHHHSEMSSGRFAGLALFGDHGHFDDVSMSGLLSRRGGSAEEFPGLWGHVNAGSDVMRIVDLPVCAHCGGELALDLNNNDYIRAESACNACGEFTLVAPELRFHIAPVRKSRDGLTKLQTSDLEMLDKVDSN